MTQSRAAAPARTVVAGAHALGLQRKCRCGTSASGLTGECEGCAREKLFGTRFQGSTRGKFETRKLTGEPGIERSGEPAARSDAGSALTLGRPGDPFERQAERLAEQVGRGASATEQPLRAQPALRRQSTTGADEHEDELLADDDAQTVRAAPASTARTSRMVAPGVAASIRSMQRQGEPLSTGIRNYFEPRLGHDLGRVRIHSNREAAATASALGAAAFTVGQDVFFGAGRLDFRSIEGRTLIAHELVHTLQLPEGSNRVQRQETDAPVARPRAPTAPSSNVTIRWRGSIRASLFVYLSSIVRTEADAARIVDLVLNSPTTEFIREDGQRVSREEFDRAPRQTVILYESMVEVIARETGYDLATLRAMSEISEELNVLQAGLSGERSLLQGGRSQEELESEIVRDIGPSTPVSGNWEVLLDDAATATLYIRLMEHYAAMPLTPAIRSMAAGGLTIEELTRITGGNRTYHYFTGLIAQGLREFRRAQGAELSHYEKLQATILDQFVWGNPTARRNQLEINTGWPERGILGIVERSSGILLYDADGQPLRSFAGGMMRDEGWVASMPAQTLGLNIAAIEDPALRGMLNMLRHQMGEPTRVIARAAQIYLDNIEAVNAKVRAGLTAEIVQKFEEALPAFVGFLAGHGVSMLLMRSPNPTVAAIGASVKTGLVALGYVMQIDFIGTAMERLLEAANHLVRVRQVEQGGLSELSQNHLELAAVPIRQMVTEVAMSAALGMLGRLLRGVSTIQCTRCRIRSREARVRRRQQGRYGEGQRVGNLDGPLTRAQLDALRRAVMRRRRVERSQITQEHRGAERHFRENDPHPNANFDFLVRAINNPQRVFMSRNGRWIFYRNGTVVITRANNPADVITAYGRGATIPQRHIDDFRAGAFGNAPNPNLRVGDPEPPVRLEQWLSAPQQSGDFAPFPIWP